MRINDQEARERIILVVKEMMKEDLDLDRLTVRQIAERAEVGIGLINYYFKSKDKLISLVVGEVMANLVSDYLSQESDGDLDPANRLKEMLKALYGFGEKHNKYVHYLIAHTLLEGDLGAAMMLIPRLKEVFPDKDEFEVRIIALQILLPIQITSLNPGAFHLYSGIDLGDAGQRNNYIDKLIDNLIAGSQR